MDFIIYYELKRADGTIIYRKEFYADAPRTEWFPESVVNADGTSTLDGFEYKPRWRMIKKPEGHG